MLGGRYAVADAATGYWSQVCPSSWRPPGLWGAASPLLLKEEGDIGAPAGISDVPSPLGPWAEPPGPLSPPTITQEMPVRSRSTGPSSGSTERKRTAVGTLRRAACLWPSSLTAQESFSGGLRRGALGNDLPWRGCGHSVGGLGAGRHPHGSAGARGACQDVRASLLAGRHGRGRGANPRPRHGHGSLPTNSHGRSQGEGNRSP